MKSWFFNVILLLCAFAGFGQQTINGTMTYNGIQRSYILYVPAVYTSSPLSDVPLVFNFHGYTSNATSQMWYGDFRSIADTAGFLVVHPQGLLDNNSTTHWNIPGWFISSVDDIGFTNALLDTLITNYSIDTNRVYSTGMSNGGFFSFLLACEMSDRIAAVASVTGGMTAMMINNCNPSHPTPVMQIHGTSDGVVAYDGSLITEPIDSIISYWVNYNGNNTPASITTLPDINTNDGSTVQWHQYLGGMNGAEVEHYKVLGGGHTWPGSGISSPGTNYDFDASAKIWEFFNKYDINGQIYPVSNSRIDSKVDISIFPNPTSSFVRIQINDFENALGYQLIDMAGQTISSGILQQPQSRLNLENIASGIYALIINGQHYKIVKI